MLTGDNKTVAKKVVDKIYIEFIFLNLLPGDKLDILDCDLGFIIVVT